MVRLTNEELPKLETKTEVKEPDQVPVRVLERAITLELVNEKLNHIINLLEGFYDSEKKQ